MTVPGPAPWMVRILDGSRSVRGAGLLVAADRVLTCAHVVPEQPAVSFVDDRAGEPLAASVVDGAFFPPAPDGADLALLALDEPRPGRSTATLRRFPAGRVERFLAYGFPDGDAVGVWATSTLVGRAGPGGEWIQLHRSAGVAVQPGFSGAGVIADPYGHLVGMMVAAYPADEQSFMIPADTIARHLPGVPWIEGPPAVPGRFRRTRPAVAPDDETLREVSAFVSRPAGANVELVVVGAEDSGRAEAVRSAVLDGDRPVGGVDLAIDCTGLTVAEVAARIAARAGVDPRQLAGDDAPPMTIVLDRVDQAAEPEALIREVVDPLCRRGANRVLATFGDGRAAALSVARDLRERSTWQVGSVRDAARTALARAQVAERVAAGLHRRAALVLADLPDAPARAAELQAAFGTAGPEELPRLRDDAEAAEKAALAVRDGLEARLAAHGDLRGLLHSYQQLSAQYGRAEDPLLAKLHARAYALLHAGPADQGEAEAAVDEFGAAVRERRP